MTGPGEAASTAKAEGGRKPVVGLAGGIGAGKSEVARLLEEMGCAVISSDEISRQALDSPEVIGILRAWWGPAVVTAEGRADRKRIADLVFADPSQRQRLEALLHPRIAAVRTKRMEEAQRQAGVPAIVVDSPLLFETGLDAQCDKVLFVEAAREVREARVGATRGWSPEELRRREASQQNVEIKSRRADFIVVNNSGREALREQVQGIFNQIIAGRTGEASC